MFGWLTDWLIGAAISRNRAIFQFWDGRRRRWVDPLLVSRRLLALDYFDMSDTPSLALSGHVESMADTARAVREAFDISPLSDSDRRVSGLTEAELVQLLDQFLMWMDTQKKSSKSTPILPPHTESPSSADEPSETHASDLDSGSTDAASFFGRAPVSSEPSSAP